MDPLPGTGNGGKQPLAPPCSLTPSLWGGRTGALGLGWPRWCFGSGLAALVLWVWTPLTDPSPWAGRAGGLGLDAASEVVAAVLSPWQRVCHPLFACVLTAQLPVSVSGQGVCYLDTSSPQTCPSI